MESFDMVETTSETRNSFAEKRAMPEGALADNLVEVGKPLNTWGTGANKFYMMCALVYLCSTMNGIATHSTSFDDKGQIVRV
jgi:hypothetical protein